MLKIVVCVKAVPDPNKADKVRIDPKTKRLNRVDIPLVINPLDKHALEAALQLKAKLGVEISVISMGPAEAGNVVIECLAYGAEYGYLLSDPAFAAADAYATAYTLACAIKKLGSFDLVFCGRESSDGATEWVGPELAMFLDWPVVTMVKEILESSSTHMIVKASIEGGYRIVKVMLPAVVTVTRELNVPRPLSFSSILKARNKQISVLNYHDLELLPEQVGEKGSPTIVTELEYLEETRACEMIEGNLDEKAEGIIQVLVRKGVLQ
ncbi:MAG: electron transfer flavoprotein subunit beta [Anaerolineales bacterium]|nr:electron transfer flavoprotein subunit beta/FixA family protein [Anaerolineae bacterium]PWB50484.1 MAG: electron transfer flavoprotein subunit beta [Anaerolineales bacterium]